MFIHLLVGISCAILAHTAAAQDTDTLSPRYTRGLGVLTSDDFLSIVNRSYRCHYPDGTITTYVRSREHGRLYLTVLGTRDGSPAREVGLTCGDVIIGINDREVTSVKELRRAINAQPNTTHVTVHIMRPASFELTDQEITPVESYERRELTIGTLTLDWVEETKKRGSPIRNYEYRDEFGPPLSVQTESTFTEVTPGFIEYRCSIKYTGEAPVLYFDSLYLSLFGPDETRPDIARDGTKVFALTESVATGGIPKEVHIPIAIARPIHTGQTAPYINKFGGAVGRIHTGQRDDWYAWSPRELICFVPERIERLFESRRQRLRVLRRTDMY